MFGRLFKVVYDGTGRSIIPTQKKKKGGTVPLNLNPSFSFVLILTIDVILMVLVTS